MPQFDPTKYGAKRVTQPDDPQVFDPTQYGARPVQAEEQQIDPAELAQQRAQRVKEPATRLGASPQQAFSRFTGIARDVGKAGMGALQWAQHIGGFKVSPTPLALEPTNDPDEQLGVQIGRTAGSLLAPAGGSRLASQMLLGSATGALGGINQGQGAATTGAMLGAAIPAGARTAGKVAEKVAQSQAPAIAKTAVSAIAKGESPLKAVADMPKDPVKTLTQALKPIATNIGFGEAAKRALPHIKEAEIALKKPIEGVQDFSDAVAIAKKNLWSKYEAIAGPQAAKGVDATPVADAILKSIPLKLRIQNPKAVKEIERIASTYRRSFTLGELDDLLRTSNAELSGYYAKYPAAQRVAKDAVPEIAQNVAEANSLRDLIYGSLDSGPEAREIKRIYGSLMNMEKEAQRRLNVAARQSPESLSEQISKWTAAMQTGRAALRFPTDPGGAARDIAGAWAGRRMATALKEANSSDALIANVFRNFKP